MNFSGLEANREKAKKLNILKIIEQNLIEGQNFEKELSKDNSQTLNLKQRYALITMHRPSNVDKKEILEPIIRFLLDEVSNDMPIIWPIHPRAQKQLQAFGLWQEVMESDSIHLLHPLGYHEMLKLNMEAKIMLTDSGGLQEGCTVLGIPLRWNTERPITLREHGDASVLVGNNVERIKEEYLNSLKFKRNPVRPELWDGKTAGRIVENLVKFGI